MQPYIHQFANFLRLHMDSISVGLVATVLRSQADLPLIGIIAGAFIVLAFCARSGKDI